MCFDAKAFVPGARGVSIFLKISEGSCRFTMIQGFAFLAAPTPSACCWVATCLRSIEGDGLIEPWRRSMGTLRAADVGVRGREASGTAAAATTELRGVAPVLGVADALLIFGFAVTDNGTARALDSGVVGLLAAGDAR